MVVVHEAGWGDIGGRLAPAVHEAGWGDIGEKKEQRKGRRWENNGMNSPPACSPYHSIGGWERLEDIELVEPGPLPTGLHRAPVGAPTVVSIGLLSLLIGINPVGVLSESSKGQVGGFGTNQ